MTHYLLDTNHASPLVTLSHPLRMRVLDAIQSGVFFFSPGLLKVMRAIDQPLH